MTRATFTAAGPPLRTSAVLAIHAMDIDRVTLGLASGRGGGCLVAVVQRQDVAGRVQQRLGETWQSTHASSSMPCYHPSSHDKK